MAWCWRSKATKKKPRRCDNRARLARQQYRKYVERFLDFARNDRQRILDTRTTIDGNLRSSPQDELAVASLRKFSPVVFRPAVAGLLECALPARLCAGVLASLLGEKAVDRKAMRRRLALPTPKPFARPHFPPRRAGSARCGRRILTYPYPCNQRAELWEQRDRRKSREGSGERARVASEFQIRG